MTITPQLCADCLRENRIATINGPTCLHQPATGAAWFPAWWGEPGADARRVVWLNTRRNDN